MFLLCFFFLFFLKNKDICKKKGKEKVSYKRKEKTANIKEISINIEINKQAESKRDKASQKERRIKIWGQTARKDKKSKQEQTVHKQRQSQKERERRTETERKETKYAAHFVRLSLQEIP